HHRRYRAMYYAHPRKRPMGNGRDLMLLNRSGEEIDADISLSPITIKEQLYTLVMLSAVDQCYQVENALRESEERLWLIKQAAGAGLFDIDCISERIYCDERMRELWWNKADEIITLEKFFAAVHPNDRARCRAAFDNAVNPVKEGICRAEFRVAQAAGHTERWIAMLGQAQFEGGAAKRIVGIVRDITERKILEQSLQQQRNETEVLFNQQVAVITASAIAHELNSPLTAISAYGEVAQRALSSTPIDCDQAKEAFQGCVEQVQHAGSKLKELLSFLQNSEVETEALNLNHVVEDALTQARGDGYAEFHLALELESDLPAVMANKIQIQRVLVNLIRNSVEALRAAEISASEITIAVKTVANESMSLVTIKDNGPGIGRDTISRIFEPFFTTKPTGFGVGLSISRALIEANGGQLWVDPDYRQGAQFHFTLPFAS
ncbi:MAG TPA: ATP-binding protein, partial [Nitrosomonas sp.]|nr:ATP-binding protein [Nitrosomonas sp.]